MNILSDICCTHVFISAIPDDVTVKEVYPRERDEDITNTSNERLRAEKYFVWRLLEYAILKVFHTNISEVSFRKSNNGRWGAEGFDFSLSHSNGACAVAVSDTSVGIDIEEICIPKSEGFAKRILSDEEFEVYLKTAKEREEYLIAKWTEKEAVFKSQNLTRFIPRETVPDMLGAVKTDSVDLNGKRYIYSVFTAENRESDIELVNLNL